MNKKMSELNDEEILKLESCGPFSCDGCMNIYTIKISSESVHSCFKKLKEKIKKRIEEKKEKVNCNECENKNNPELCVCCFNLKNKEQQVVNNFKKKVKVKKWKWVLKDINCKNEGNYFVHTNYMSDSDFYNFSNGLIPVCKIEESEKEF